MRSERIMIAPNDIAGYYGKLEKGLSDLGYSVIFANFYAERSGYAFDHSSWKLVAKAQRSLAKSWNRNGTIAADLRLSTVLLYYFYSLLTLIYSLNRIDTYIFVYGRSFFPWNLDLPILRILGKKTISVIGHGSETRPPYLFYNGVSSASEEIDDALIKDMYRTTQSMKNQIARIEKYSTYIVGSSVTCQLLTKNFIEMYALRQPINLHVIQARTHELKNSITILHSPSDPIVKGSSVIRDIINNIQARYPNFKIEFVEISGVSNSEVIAAISKADLVIDQLWSDSPMAMIGYESASLGTPSLTFGAALSTFKKIDEKIPLPIFGYFSSDEAQSVILDFILNKHKRDELATLQSGFVKEYATIRNVAENFARIIDNDIPQTWIANPNECLYFGGGGIPAEVSLKQMNALAKRYGIDSLNWINAKKVLKEQKVGKGDA